MKKKFTSESVSARRSFSEGGFFSLRVLVGLFIGLAGPLALLATANPSRPAAAQARQKYNSPKYDPKAVSAIDPLRRIPRV